MNQLVLAIQPAAVPVSLSLAHVEIEQAMAFAEMEKSPGTRRVYRSDFNIFVAWCCERGLESMPATPGTVARFLSHQPGLGDPPAPRRLSATQRRSAPA